MTIRRSGLAGFAEAVRWLALQADIALPAALIIPVDGSLMGTIEPSA